MKLSLPKDFVGENYEITPIKNWTVRTRNRLKKAQRRQPVVYRILTKSGETFKLLKAHGSACQELQRISSVRAKLDGEINVPQILWSDEDHLLIEYIEGNFPDQSQKNFLIDLATAFAKMHSHSLTVCKREFLLDECFTDLKYLEDKKLIDKDICAKIKALLFSKVPETIQYGLTYADLNKSNFIYDGKGDLWFIDLGSFQEKIPLDQHLTGGQFLENVTRLIFRDAYFAAGGITQVYDLYEIFGIINFIRVASQNSRQLEYKWWGSGFGKLVPLLDYKLIRAKRTNVSWAIKNLKDNI